MTDDSWFQIIFSIASYAIIIAAITVVWVVSEKRKKNQKQLLRKYWADYQALFNYYSAEKNRLTKGCQQYVFVDSLPNAVARFPQGLLSYDISVSGRRADQILVFEDYPPIEPKTDWNGRAYPGSGGSIRIVSGFFLSDVLYWAEKGSVQFTSNVSGGGSDLTGALVGGAIAGDVGAIIGSRDPIKTETIRHDTRRIIIKMRDAKEFEYPFSFYHAFIACMPEKEYEYLKMSNKLN